MRAHHRESTTYLLNEKAQFLTAEMNPDRRESRNGLTAVLNRQKGMKYLPHPRHFCITYASFLIAAHRLKSHIPLCSFRTDVNRTGLRGRIASLRAILPCPAYNFGRESRHDSKAVE